jgi:hypothetical protein
MCPRYRNVLRKDLSWTSQTGSQIIADQCCRDLAFQKAVSRLYKAPTCLRTGSNWALTMGEDEATADEATAYVSPSNCAATEKSLRKPNDCPGTKKRTLYLSLICHFFVAPRLKAHRHETPAYQFHNFAGLLLEYEFSRFVS